VVETKKEKRRKRREAKEAEAKAKAEAAKKRAKEGFGEGDGEWMESDPDRSEESSEEQMESYFDLVKRFTTKKTLPAVDHSKIDYKPFRKNLYVQVKEITNMKDHEVDNLRRTQGDITIRGKRCPHPITSFLQCGLPERVMKILEKREYDSPFPVQMQAIPALMCGRDVIGVAQTGSGKTLAYLLPIVRHILDQPKLGNGDGPVGFVVAPTRELALQIQREAGVFCKAVNLTSVCAYGGGPMGEQLSALKKGAELMVGTPGRLIDVLTISGGKITNLRRVTFMVLDEADRMFDMGFEPQIGMFLQSTRPDKQVAMFSATLPSHVEALARTVLKKPVEITVGERNTAATNVVQFVEVLDESQKFYRLLQLLGEWHEHGAIIIFVHKQQDVDEMFTELLKYGYPPLALHGGQDQQDRDFTLQDFKDGVSNILIATSVAARGIDVKNVILVVNFKVPDHLEDYIHRIGRTGRAGKAGYAYTFVQPDEASHAQDMVDALRQCNQEVPLKLKALAEEHQTAINKGEAEKKKRWGGFGGKGFKYDNTEKSRQQKDRQNAKTELLIGDMDDEEDEFRDPWFEPDAPKQGKGKGRGKGKKDNESSAQSNASTGSGNTVAAAHEVAAKMQADADAASGGTKAPPPPPPKAIIAQKSDKEIEEQAQLMAEEALKTLPDEIRDEKLLALKDKLILKLRKAEKDKLAEAATALAKVPAPPPKETEPEVPPLLKAIPLVPGVLGQGFVPAKDNMVTKAISSLQSQAAKPGRDTAQLAEDKASQMLHGNTHLAGMFCEELDINDYPQVARQKITHRDPLVAIEEMTGCRVQVRGQHFLPNAKMPEGARKLYVECVGPTSVAAAKAKHEVFKMMEARAIRTLNIPGLTQKIGGTPGKYNPAAGM
jgi:ATP-dependent RNA helicase DDX46/PRP5